MKNTDSRRRLLLAACALPWLPAIAKDTAAARIVIVGGGWGGLAAAAELRRQAPGADVLLLDRQPEFVSFAGSNRWLVDAAGTTLMHQAYRAIAAARGYRFVQADVEAIDRTAQRVHTPTGVFPYDWLILAPGIRENHAAWGLNDAAAVDRLKSRFSGGMLHASELAGLRQRLQAFRGGDLLMNIPPAPYRCPPAPYERAMYLANWLKTQRISGKLIIVDPNPIMPAFRSILLERYREQVVYFDHAQVRSVDLEKRLLSTDVDDIPFDEALLSPPQQAATLLHSAGLLRRGDAWADQDAVSLASRQDARVFVIGDATGLVSPLFGSYPKTGHLAARSGQLVARRITALIAGRQPESQLPDSICHLALSLEPGESLRIEAEYRLRGDGVPMQSLRQTRENLASGEELAWAAAHYRDFLVPG